MQSLNVILVGNGKFVPVLKNSKYLHKLYVTSGEEISGVITLQFNTFKQLAKICKAFQIDIVISEEERWVLEGITNVMKKNHINCLAATSEWTNLALSHSYARHMLTKYEIATPPIVTLPAEFPVIVKGDGILKIAKSMQEVISVKEHVYNMSAEISKNVFLEKYLYGKKHKITSFFDGKNILTFPNKEINKDLLNEYSEKLKRVLVSEKADFIGVINSNLIEEDKVLYNTGFSFEFVIPDLSCMPDNYPKDILFLSLLMMYQKLDEIELK